MANELNIGVKFGAEGIPQVTKSISQLEAQLKRFQAGLKDAVGIDSIARLNKAIENTKQRITDLQKFKGFGNLSDDVDEATKSFNKLKPGANEATFALTNLSRVAQDAPFGFIGIANNINPLLESFQRLKQQTGTTQGAFKTLIGSLSGAGGLGLAIGLGSAALTLLGQGFFSSGKAAKKASEEVDEFKKLLGEVSGAVGQDAARVTTLFNALNSGTLNVEERKKALEELKSINKDFFGSLREEEGLIKNLEIAYDNYLAKVLDIGRAKAIESQLTKLFDQKIQLELSIDPKFLTQTNKTAQQALGNLRKQLKQLGGEVSQEELKNANFFAKGNENLNKRVELQQQISTLERGFNVIQDEGVKKTQEQIRNIDLRIAGLSKLQQDQDEFNIKTDKASTKEEDSLKKRLTALEKIRDLTKDLSVVADLQEQIFDLQVKITLRDAAKNGLSKEETDLAIAGFRKQLSDAFEKETLSLEGITKIKFTKLEVAEFSPAEIDALIKGTKLQLDKAKFDIAKAAGVDKNIPIESDRQVLIRLKGIDFVLAQEETKKAVERLRETILNGAVDAFATIGSSFGEALAGAFGGGGVGEALAKAGQSLLSGIGGVLQEIGKQIIATSALIKSLKEALKSLISNPVAGIAIGLGLVALGSLLKNIKIPAFAGGVNNFSGGLALVGERGPELVNLPRGSDVIPNHMLGGGNTNIVLGAVVEFGYDKLRIGLQRQEERRRRI